MKLESKFRKRLFDSLQGVFGREFYGQVHHGSEYSAGLPDVLICVKGYGHVLLELKAMETWRGWSWLENPTPLQKSNLRRIHMAGGACGVLIWIEEARVALGVHNNLLISCFDEAVWPASAFRHTALSMGCTWPNPTSDSLLRLCYGRHLRTAPSPS